MSELPPPGPFTGDPKNRYVAKFLDDMGKQRRRTTALHVITALVKAKYPIWLAEQTLAELSKAINHTPHKPPRGRPPVLTIISGDDHDTQK